MRNSTDQVSTPFSSKICWWICSSVALAYDVRRIRSYPFLPRDTVVAGAGYDVHTGRLEPRDY